MDRKLIGLAEVPLSAKAELIGLIEAGELNPFEVEIQRRQAGLPKLAGWADPTGFDPMKQLAWSLVQVVAWIIWRSPEAVREQWPEYRSQSTFWNTRTDVQGDDLVTRYFIDQKPQRSIGHMIASAHARDALQHVRASDAVEELLGKLQDERSELVGTGLPKPNGRRDKIPVEEWLDIIPFDGDRHYDGAGPQSESEPRWFEVKIRRDDVLRLWPPLPVFAATIAVGVPVSTREIAPAAGEAVIAAEAIGSGAANDVNVYKTGYPGRPSSAHFINAELLGRAARGDLLPKISQEAAYLETWLRTEYPYAPSAKAAAIENAIRERYWQLRKPGKRP